MDYTSSDAYVTHAGTGRRMHQDTAPVTTMVSADDMNQVIWSLMHVIGASGLSGIQFDSDVPASYMRLYEALQLSFMAAGDARDYVTNRSGEALSATVTRAGNRRVELSAGEISADAVALQGGVRGKGVASTLVKAIGTSEAIKLGWISTPSQWAYREVEALTIDGNVRSADGLSFEQSSATEVSGRWMLDKIAVKACRRGIYKGTGNIGNVLSSVNLTDNDYGYYAVGQTAPLMHAGADTFLGGEISSNALAGVYINSQQIGSGGTQFRGTIIEYNAGFGVFVKSWADSYTPLLFDGVWFEGNGSAATVLIDGVSYTPVDLYLENTRFAVLTNGVVPKIRLVASRLSISNSTLSADVAGYSVDAASYCEADRVQVDGGAHPILINRVIACRRQLGNFSARWRGSPRRIVAAAAGTPLQVESYATANTYTFPGTVTAVAKSVPDGQIFGACAELTILPGYGHVQPVVSITAGKWVMLTLDVKVQSGAAADLRMSFVGSGAAFAGLHDVVAADGWTTVVAMGYADASFTAQLNVQNAGAGSLVVRLSALQVRQFDHEPGMLDYYNKGFYVSGSGYPRSVYSTAAPTDGAWVVGDRVWNIVPTVGQPKSWVCRVAGTPGTWSSEGNL